MINAYFTPESIVEVDRIEVSIAEIQLLKHWTEHEGMDSLCDGKAVPVPACLIRIACFIANRMPWLWDVSPPKGQLPLF